MPSPPSRGSSSVGRGDRLPVVDLRRDPAAVPVRDVPDEQPEQARARLPTAATRTTRIRRCRPSSRRRRDRTATRRRAPACGCSRATRCSRSSVGSSVPWMPTPGRVQPHPARAERVVGPGRHGLQALRPGVLRRRVPPRVLPLDDDVEGAARRRVDRLAGRDREGAPELRRRRRDRDGWSTRLITITAPNDVARSPSARSRVVRTRTGRREFDAQRGDDARGQQLRVERATEACPCVIDGLRVLEARAWRRRRGRAKRFDDAADPRAERRPVHRDDELDVRARRRRCAPARRRSRCTRTRQRVGSSRSLLRSTTTGSGVANAVCDRGDGVGRRQAADPHACDPDAGRQRRRRRGVVVVVVVRRRRGRRRRRRRSSSSVVVDGRRRDVGDHGPGEHARRPRSRARRGRLRAAASRARAV